jgi:hypothetical protein
MGKIHSGHKKPVITYWHKKSIFLLAIIMLKLEKKVFFFALFDFDLSDFLRDQDQQLN